MKKDVLLLLILTIIFYFLITVSIAAQIKISGKITDKDSNPLPSANIYLKDTYDGVSSETDGSYSFTTTETGEQMLVVSYVGYKTQERKVEISSKNLVEDFVMLDESSSLNTVVISAGAFEASDENKSVILRPLDIVTTGTTADIYTALSTLPGTQQVGEETGLFVRGGSAAETKTIIDEMIVQTPFYSTVPDITSRGRFSPMLFKGTMFSSGGYSAQYGQALSSALILRSADLAPDTRSAINLMVVGFGGAHTQRWENTSIAAEAGYYDLTPYFQIQKQRQDWDRSPRTAEGQVIFRHKTSETGMLKVYSSFNDSYLKLNMRNLDSLLIFDKFGLQNNNFYFNTSYTEIFGKEWAFFSGASYSKDIDEIEWNSDKIKTSDELRQFKTTLSRKIFDGSFITFGGEIQNLIYDNGFNQYSMKLDEFYSAAFVESDIFFSNNIAARIGIRAEHSKLLNKFNLAPRTSLAYKLGKYDQINLAHGIFYQTPEKDMLFSSTDLHYERADHYILNYQYLGDVITFRIEGYYKQYHNLVKGIDDNPADYNQVLTQLNNSGKGYAKGIDVFFRGTNMIPNVDYWISYSYLDTKREYRAFPTLAPPVFAAPHTFSIVYKQWFASILTSVGITLSHAAGRPYYNPGNPDFHGDRTKYYNNLGINISHLTSLFNNFTVIFFSIDNVLGRNNVFSYRYSKDGSIREPVLAPSLRSVFIGMFISIGKNPLTGN